MINTKRCDLFWLSLFEMAAEKKRIGVIGVGQHKTDVVVELMQGLCGIPSERMRLGTLTEDDLRCMKEWTERLQGLSLYVSEVGDTVSTESFANGLEAIEAEMDDKGIDVLILLRKKP